MTNEGINQNSGLMGLTEAAVIARRLAGQGNNVSLPSSRSYLQILRENVFTFINGVFLTICVVLIWLGNKGDAVLVVVAILGGVVVNVIQEMWAKQKLDRIALLTRPKATVLRAGIEHNIDPREIVQGDVLVVRSGDQILVDGQVVGEGQIEVDESLLTGESDLVPKQAGAPVYSGSFCVSGTACYEAQKVGKESMAYQLAASARTFRQMFTPLQREINLVIRVFVLLACFLWFLTGIATLTAPINLEDGVQRAAVIAGLVPSGLYLTITLAYAIGAVQMIGQDVLIQQANAVESLSNVDILCLDKTGTLTANRIHLEQIYPIDMAEAELRQLLGDYAASTFDGNRTTEAILDHCPGSVQPIYAKIPFTSARKWSALALDTPTRRGVYILGAPEIIMPSLSLPPESLEYIQTQVQKGLRVLLFAYSSNITDLGATHQPELPSILMPLGILSFSDELRQEARETLTRFADAGIALKIISGDNPETVVALARQVGMGPDIQMVSGADLAQMDDAELSQAAADNTVFGRITPDQKAKLVQSLRQRGFYVAMIGDGVNDVLSLKQANLAIAMESGSKATRSVADIVLLKDSFGSLPYTFLEGQRIRNAIQDVLKLFMVRVFCVSLLIFSSGQVLGTFPMLNKHSAVVTILAVGLPTFGFPLWAKPGMLPRRSMLRSLLHFTLPAVLTLTITSLAVYLGYLVVKIWALEASGCVIIDNTLLSVPRSALVTILVVCELMLVPFLKPPTAAWVGGERLCGDWRYTFVAFGLLILYVTVLAVPPLREFFELSLLGVNDYLLLGLVALLWCIFLRYSWRNRLLDRFLGVDLS